MQRLAISVFVASVIFFGLMVAFDVLFGGASLDMGTVMGNVFKALIFAMVLAALKVGAIIFRGDDPK